MKSIEQEHIDAYVKQLVDAAPPLTADQRTHLAELLRPVRIGRTAKGREAVGGKT